MPKIAYFGKFRCAMLQTIESSAKRFYTWHVVRERRAFAHHHSWSVRSSAAEQVSYTHPVEGSIPSGPTKVDDFFYI